MKKIIIHNGQFHADDVMAVVIIRSMLDQNIPVERKNNVLLSELDDPEVCVVDVGGCYSPEHNNYDHHQDVFLEAACVLVAKQFIGDELSAMLYHILNPISDCDRGNSPVTAGSINAIVRQFNGIHNGFNRAVDICGEIFNAYYFTARKSLGDKARWNDLEKINGIIAVQTDTDVILSWKQYAEVEGIRYLICPSNREEGKWNVISRDSNLFPIVPDDLQTFRHNSGFMAVYNSKDDAIYMTI